MLFSYLATQLNIGRLVTTIKRACAVNRMSVDSNVPKQIEGSGGLLAYDGLCPLCDIYCHAMARTEAVENLALVDARRSTATRMEIESAGLDLDAGFALKWGDHYYHGAEALHALTKLSRGTDPFHRLNRILFRSPAVCRAVYPIFRLYRAGLLWVLGVPSIKDGAGEGRAP